MRPHVATTKQLIKELEGVGFVLIQGRHPKLKHPQAGVAITLPRSSTACDGIFAMKVRKLVKLYQLPKEKQ